MRVMTMLENARTSEDIERARQAAASRGWSPAQFERKLGGFKRLTKLQAQPKTREVESYGVFRVRLVPHAGDEARTPQPELATVQELNVRRVQGKRKTRVAIGSMLVSERAWDTIKAGGTVKVWPTAESSMHYLSLVLL